jgi:hypothetical protein
MAILVGCSGCGKQFRARDQFRNTRLKCPSCKADVVVQGPHVCGSDVFISHSSADKQVADAVCAAMESKNFRCWIAPRDIPAGVSWGSAIIEGIEDSRLMLLVFSQHANKSDQVLREVERAVAKKKPVVPLRIDAEPMRKDFEYFLASSQWLDATDGPLESHLAGLTSRVRHLLMDRAEAEADDAAPAKGKAVSAVMPAGAAPQVAEVPETTPRAPRRRPAAALALACLVGIVAVAIGAFYATRDSGDSSGAVPTAASSSQPTTSTPASASATIDLLGGVVLPRDAVSGTWKRTDAGLEGTGDSPLRLRFTNPPEGDYDVRVAFTPTFGLDGVGIILTRNGKSFAYFMGMYRGPAFRFERVGNFSRLAGRSSRASLTTKERHTALVKVRKNSVTAFVDGEPAGELLTTYNDLDLALPWRIGPNVLGITSYRNVVIHSAECIGVMSSD